MSGGEKKRRVANERKPRERATDAELLRRGYRKL